MSASEIALPFVLFLVAFPAMWIGVTWLLGWLSGWHALQARYPDKAEKAQAELTWQTGSMGIGVNYKNILKLGACQSGLRVGVPKFFAPFSAPFLVPWEKIKVRRMKWMWVDVAELTFGDEGKLAVLAAVADKLKAAAGKRWPEK